MSSALEPFSIAIPQSALDDLDERLRRTRLPEEPAGAGWEYGTSLAYMRRLLHYWQSEYDWRRVETRLNRFASAHGHARRLPYPSRLAYGLTDSPVGLAAWIVEKSHGWSDADALEPPFSMEQLITNVMTYWLTGCANSASWLYTAARREGGMRLAKDELVGVPTAFMAAPNDLFPPPPDDWVKRAYNCVRRTDLREGGHFAAYQNGADFIEDLRAFVRPFRAR